MTCHAGRAWLEPECHACDRTHVRVPAPGCQPRGLLQEGEATWLELRDRVKNLTPSGRAGARCPHASRSASMLRPAHDAWLCRRTHGWLPYAAVPGTWHSSSAPRPCDFHSTLWTHARRYAIVRTQVHKASTYTKFGVDPNPTLPPVRAVRLRCTVATRVVVDVGRARHEVAGSTLGCAVHHRDAGPIRDRHHWLCGIQRRSGSA